MNRGLTRQTASLPAAQPRWISFVLAPFAAVGAMFDRLGTGVLVGLVFVVVSAALLKGF